MSMLSTFHTAYLAAWLLASLVAVALLIRNRRRYVVFTTAYRRFLFQPWKVATFLIAGVSMTVKSTASAGGLGSTGRGQTAGRGVSMLGLERV